MDEGELLVVLRGGSQDDLAVERDAVELEVEALAVGMRPGRADAGPEALASFAVTDLISRVARGLVASGGGMGVRVSHVLSPLFVSIECSRPRPSRP